MYKKEKRSWMKHIDFTIADILCLQAAFIISYFIRLGFMVPYKNEPYQRLAIILLMLDICVVFFVETYQGILRRNHWQELKAVLMHCTVIFLGMTSYVWVTKQSEIYSRQILLVFWGLSIVFEYVEHCALKIWVRKRLRNAKNQSAMIIVTTDERVEQCIKDFESNRYREFIVRGVVVVDKDRKGEVIREIPVVANADDFFEYVRTNVVDEVFINGNSIDSSEALAEDLLEMGVTVHFKLVHESKLMPNKVIEECGNYMVLTSSMCIASPRQLFIKRCMDIFGSLIGLVIMGIAFLIFAPVIKHQSPGPIFFSQIRVGKNGRKFKIYKFRSMYTDAEERKQELMKDNEMDGLMFKMDNDPRVFPAGKIMRKLSIDELPQFWNILKGEMSLVGTRPPTVDEFVQYEAHHRARLGIKPGLTGMWQVSGRSDITDFEEVVKLDTQYISNWSLGLDVKILFKTIEVVLMGSGAK